MNIIVKDIAIQLAAMHCEDETMWQDYEDWAIRIYNKIAKRLKRTKTPADTQ